ncbi:MAG: arylsulfatase [Planctomycetota bacterium]
MIKFLTAVLCFHTVAIAADATRPNVVVFLTDDQGWGDLSVHGNTALDTPNIDRLARSGASFDRFYVSPVCSPTRAEFLTGRHHVRCGVYSTSAGGERLNADEVTIADLFRDAGYRTAAFGKWHSGMQYPYHPNARGFEDFYGFCSGHWGDYFDPPLEHNGEPVRGRGYIVDDLTERAMSYMEDHRDEPFFIYLPYNTPHSPMQVPDRWWEKFRDMELTQDHPKKKREKIDHTRAALAMCENIDWNVGRVLSKLEELGLEEDTIVLYFSDNGPNGDRWNGGMRGRKGSTDEGGVRSPLFVRWPARIPPRTEVAEISSAMDLLPTLAEAAGVDAGATKPLDGVSLLPLLTGEEAAWEPRTLVQHWKGKVSVRTQRHRLDHTGRLYDIVDDPSQLVEINESLPDVVDSLTAVADRFRTEMLSEYGPKFDDRPFAVGHPDEAVTQLPVRDAEAHGNVTRSNKYPNDSYFLNWTSDADSVTWDCEVVASGRFDVDLLYACPAADVGSTVELGFRGASVSGRVTDPHDPPLTGMENDRFRRAESYVKDFKIMRLGTIALQAGPGVLELRARDIPGSQVMELRAMYLRRVE